MFEPVTPVTAEAPAVGLVRSAITRDGGRWQQGFAWRSERCPAAETFDPCGSTFSAPVGSGNGDIVYHRPVAFRVTEQCTTRNIERTDERVRRQAAAITSWMVARELEQGALTRANPYETPDSGGDVTVVNGYLADAAGTVVAGGPYPPRVALGLLEEATRDAQLGMDAWIHIPTSLVPLVSEALVKVGDMLFTQTGARVVADSGYSGVGPLGAGTSEVQTVTITGTPTGGTFTLNYNGQVTAPIAFDANAAAVDTALEALSNLEPGDVTVGGGPGPDTPWTVTFAAELGNVTQMIAAHAFTGGVAPAIAVTTTTPGVNPPAETGTWMYATGPVVVRLDDVQVLSSIDHANNQINRIAERLISAAFDPCTLHAVSVEIPTS